MHALTLRIQKEAPQWGIDVSHDVTGRDPLVFITVGRCDSMSCHAATDSSTVDCVTDLRSRR